MDFAGRVFLASIEEDNAQRALFRVRPLLDWQGPVRQEEIDELGDEGYLRIVPDRHEQYSFKERMRTLGDLCLIDLQHTEPEANKVRPNKNYAPGRGENNRFVLYSDAVRALGDRRLFEVVADPQALPPLTDQYYQRSGGHIQGPFNKSDDQPVDALSCIAPDSDRLFAITTPGGRERLFFWPEEELPPEAVPQAERLSASEQIRLMDAQVVHRLRAGAKEEPPEVPAAAPPQRLSGTPLLRGSLRGNRIARANAAQQERGQSRQASLLVPMLSQQLQSLEAERLALVVELDRLKEDRQALLQEALAQQAHSAQQEERQEQALQEKIEALRAELAGLLQQRDSLMDQLGQPHLAPPVGEEVCLDKATKLVQEGMQKAGFEMERDEASHLLLLCLLFDRVRLEAAWLSDAQLGALGLAGALGAALQRCDEGTAAPAMMQGGDGFAFAIGPVGGGTGLCHLCPAQRRPRAGQAAQQPQPWPSVPLKARPGFALAQAVEGTALSRVHLHQQAKALEAELSESMLEQLNSIDSKLLAMHKSLPLSLRQDMLRYLAIAQGMHQGAAPAALDFACMSFLLPFLRQQDIDHQLLMPLLDQLPRTKAAL